jgi:hypothetical protein
MRMTPAEVLIVGGLAKPSPFNFTQNSTARSLAEARRQASPITTPLTTGRINAHQSNDEVNA